MTEIEYDIIDELYFVSSFEDIAKAFNLDDEELCGHLAGLVKKGYVKALYPDPDTEIDFNEGLFNIYCRQYYYLATKAGLISHNTR